MVECLSFVVHRDDIRRWAVRRAHVRADDGVLLRVERFALTANNVTYAAFGERLSYWSFFPVDLEVGVTPAWGFGEVLESDVEGIAVGDRYWGYMPMASHVRLLPGEITSSGFTDVAPHRRSLTAGYNRYERVIASHQPASEEALMLVRPLFLTAAALDDFVGEAAELPRVLISSASSKTSAAAAFLLARRPDLEVIGLTSARHLAYVAQLGCYDRVLAYERLGDLEADAAIGYLDISGAGALREQVHARFRALKFSCAVGATSWDRMRSGNSDLPGPRPLRFSVPAQIARRVAAMGEAAFQAEHAQTFKAFVAVALGPNAPWVVPTFDAGVGAVARCWGALLDGAVDPRSGHILSLSE